MNIAFEVSTLIPATPQAVYEAWLDSQRHSSMTGSPAIISSEVGGRFEAWDGYIEGRNLELEPGRRIVQAWRTGEFAINEPDSLVEIVFEPTHQGTRIIIRHSELPQHGSQYEQGWVDFYFQPMRAYFKTA